MRINIRIPASALKAINIHIGKPVGPVRLRIEGAWLVVEVLASTIKIRSHAENGKVVLDNLEVSGLLWPARSKIRKSLEESTKKIFVHDLSIRPEEIHVSFSLPKS